MKIYSFLLIVVISFIESTRTGEYCYKNRNIDVYQEILAFCSEFLSVHTKHCLDDLQRKEINECAHNKI